MSAEKFDQFADRHRADLEELTEAVFLSHAGCPFARVLTELMLKSETYNTLPLSDSLPSAAWTISQGRRFVSRQGAASLQRRV
jgi:hypothetical protein